jgi:hypothetical protein
MILAPKSPLQNRLLFHLSHKFNDEKRLMGYHANLKDVIEDQLSLASIHYLRSHYQEAIDIYKRILLDNRSVNNEHCYRVAKLVRAMLNGKNSLDLFHNVWVLTISKIRSDQKAQYYKCQLRVAELLLLKSERLT